MQKGKLLPEKIVSKQFQRTREHIGLQDPEKIKEFSIRTIATYAAEGMVFSELSETTEYSNCVWLNIEETDDRTIAITNSLRIKEGNGPLPMLFLG